ncbi:MAG: hypothetical protein D6784_17030 [Chloroflexi bacterium]|nr:MAG: hypothetical protein D6784_17030 [Chloroflexota bacterium]
MHHRRFILSILFLFVLFLPGWGWEQPARADGPPPDYACRGCHGTNQRQLTLPSGETLPLQVPLDELDRSAHSPTADQAVYCTACHQGRRRYRYPHQPNPAQNQRQLRQAMSAVCQDCHYPHRPLHDGLETSDDLPECVDCHGSHQIDRVNNILTRMSAACLSCHTNQTEAWVADLIAPRPGLGQAAQEYVGSDRCGGCHEDIYFSWRQTLHARMVQDPASNPNAIVADFQQSDPDLTFTRDEVAYTIGSRWKQLFITRQEDGTLTILPAQWNVASREWVPYRPEPGQPEDWRQACGSCHVTGLDTQTWGFEEFGIGCESCHGPGGEHVSNPEKVKPYAQVDDQVCGACHSRGRSPAGHPYPESYRPGDTLTDHFTFTTAETDVWPDGSARKNHQQYMDWQLGSLMAQATTTNCTSCHAVHDPGAAQGQLVAPVNDLCLQCHGDKKVIVRHTPFHDNAVRKRQFACTDCHMPKMAVSAEAYDIHNHSFLQPDPQASLDHGGLDKMPNACSTCHTDRAEDPAWAVSIINFAKKNYAMEYRSVFGAGPTPTPPPPPTPPPSVIEPAEPEPLPENGETGRSPAVYLGLGIVLVVLVFIGYRYWKSRQVNHA